MLLVAPVKDEHSAAPAQAGTLDKIPWVYHARGLALMLIVYRHIVLGMKFSGVEVSAFMYNFQLFFFNFRMPAFFFLSGVFIAKSLKKRSASAVAKNKAGNLLYPYLLWASITLLLQINFRQFSNARRQWSDFADIIVQPRSLDQLWYLIALFNASMLYILLHKHFEKKIWAHILIALVLHFTSFYLGDLSFFTDFFFFYIFFFTGAWASDWLINKEKRNKVLNVAYLKWLLPLFLLAQWFWFTHMKEDGWYDVVFLVIAYIGCYFLFNVAVLISKTNKTLWLAYIGRYSLYIYILHVQIAAIIRKVVRNAYPNVDSWLLFSICFIFAIILPIVIVRTFKNQGIERLFTLQKGKEA